MTSSDQNLETENSKQQKLRFLNRASKRLSTGDTLALFAIGTFGLHILSFFILLLLYGSYSQLSRKSPPSLVQLETGKSIKVAPIGSLERTPQVVLHFVSDTMTLMMNWSGMLPPTTVEEAAKPKADPGINIRSLNNKRSKVTSSAWDELPTLYLPALVNWLNESREDGFVGILGYQNIAQLEKVYGKELTRAILGGTATKFIFNPQDPESAKLFSDYLGEMEIKFNSKSRSAGKGGASHSTNEQHQKRHLFEAAQFTKMGTGKAVIINPAYTRGTEAYVPILQAIKVPATDIAEMNWSEGKWDFIRDKLIQNNSMQISDSERSQQFMERRELAEKLFPLPEQSHSLPSPEELANVF